MTRAIAGEFVFTHKAVLFLAGLAEVLVFLPSGQRSSATFQRLRLSQAEALAFVAALASNYVVKRTAGRGFNVS